MPKLYVVATPIGNLQDMTPRAIKTLKSVALIAAEDTRVTLRLCQVFDIHTPLTSCHRHNEAVKGETIAERMLQENIDVAITTDAGTPCISDPGYALVAAAAERGIEVIPIPGACAAVSALSVSGFDTREFAFYGFLPREKKALREKLLSLLQGPNIAVLHESPYRIIDLMEAIAEALPGARVSLSDDLTKLHEKTLRGPAEQVLQLLRDDPKAEKGEYCLVLDLADVAREQAPAEPERPLEEQLLALVGQGLTLREAQEYLIAAGQRKNAVKAAVLTIKRSE